jgi:hypothetical protein
LNTLVPIVGLFTIAMLWEQPGCPSTDEGIREIWIYEMNINICGFICVYIHIYLNTIVYYSATKNEIMSFEENRTRDHHVYQNKTNIERQASYAVSHMWTLKT